MTIEEVKEKTLIVFSRLGQGDQETLYKYAQMVPENGLIVDIGTNFGMSCLTMALSSLPSVKVITMDPFKNDKFPNFVRSFGLNKKVLYVQKTSDAVGEQWDETPIDLLFIDGIHNYDGVTNDIKGLGKYVRKGGYILAHDYGIYNGIREAMDEAVKNEVIELVELAESHSDGKMLGIYVGRKI